MKLSYYLIGLLLLLVFLSISIGTSDFSWGKLFDFDQQTWLLFQESRLPRTISILLTASSMSMAGLLMQTITQNQFAAPSTVGTTEAAKLGMVLSLFVFPSASLTQKMLFAFVSSIVFTLFFLAFMTIFTVKERWMLPLIGIIYSGIIGSVTEVIAYRFNLVQSMTAWTQGSFSMIQTHQYEWLFLGLIILIAVWKLSQTFTIMNLGKETSESLGISYSLLEKLALFLIALTTSVTMITVGALPFLGVIVPNLVRKRYGDNLSQTKLIVALVGANLVQSMTAWTQGSFSMIQTHQYEWLFLGLIILIGVWKLSQTFTIMNLGKEASESLGISYSLLEKLALFLVALTTSVTMITVGGLPFLGVIVPNLVRKRYGDNLSQTKLMVALVGANLVLACDILSRVLIRPYELSVSLLLGIIGSLVFILLLWRGGRKDAV